MPIINGQLNTMLRIIDQNRDENGVIDDIRPIITNITLDIICGKELSI